LRGGVEKSNLNQASTSLRDQKETRLIHLPKKEEDFGRLGGEEERRTMERVERRRRNSLPSLERERRWKMRYFGANFK
jgi:hypothetical protein